ncbi:MAG TPA: RDD family protein [Amycolatopsis sp.]|nr:RDD family protein [Amycolatopsis sp.]HKS43788.1 RDD family protein [Amycolatopsis sp.]
MSAEPLVTGEAVVLDLRIARLASRGVAAALDLLLQFAVLLVVLVAVIVAGVEDGAQAAAILLGVFVLVRVGYPVLFETLGGGRTLGKMALGLRVVRDDGGPIRFRHALTRALAGVIVDFGPVLVWSAVAIVVSLCSEKSKRVGDFLAGTVVITDRAPDTPAPAITMPPALASWAGQLDLSALTDDLALAARQYLARYPQLRPEARDALGHELAREVAYRIGTPLPYGVPPWAFLQAMLAERRDRSLGCVPRFPGVQPPGPDRWQAPEPPSVVPVTPPVPPPADGPFTPPA